MHTTLRRIILATIVLAMLCGSALAGLNVWTGDGPFAPVSGHREVFALVISSDGSTIFSGLGSGTVMSFSFDIPLPPPTVTGITPASGINTTTTAVTVTGTGFNTTITPTVRLNRNGYTNVTLTEVSTSSSTSLTATVPKDAIAGLWNVVVVNPDDQEGMLTDGFTVTAPGIIPPPSVTSVIPATAVNNSAVSVEITGLLFNTTMPKETTVNLTRSGYPNISVTGITPHSTTGITVSLPVTSAEAGTWYLIVVNPDGQESTESIPFLITGEDTLPPPSVSSVSPATAVNNSAVSVEITGLLFNTTMRGETTVNLTRSGYPNISVTGITPHSTTGITVSLPVTSAEAGTWYLIVVNPDGQVSMELITFVITSPDVTPVPTTAPGTTAAPSGSYGSSYSGSRHSPSMRTSETSNDGTKTDDGGQLAPTGSQNGNGNTGHPGDSGTAPGSGNPGNAGGALPTGTGLPLSMIAGLIGAGGIGIAGSAWYIRRWQINKKEFDPLWWKGGK